MDGLTSSTQASSEDRSIPPTRSSPGSPTPSRNIHSSIHASGRINTRSITKLLQAERTDPSSDTNNGDVPMNDYQSS
jgi:hypothetical protein